MKERPILFSGPMVRTILDGRKTQTRRVVRVDQTHDKRTGIRPYVNRAGNRRWLEDFGKCYVLSNIKCPYGEPGDRLWVRETWYCDDFSVGNFADPGYTPARSREAQIADWRKEMYYRADGEPQWEEGGSTPWKPSIHMPRWASRLLLDVVAVRVERLQEISEADAIAEGCPGWGYRDSFTGDADCQYPHDEFRELWDGINAKRGHSWDSNPWVWVVEFRRIDG